MTMWQRMRRSVFGPSWRETMVRGEEAVQGVIHLRREHDRLLRELERAWLLQSQAQREATEVREQADWFVNKLCNLIDDDRDGEEGAEAIILEWVKELLEETQVVKTLPNFIEAAWEALAALGEHCQAMYDPGTNSLAAHYRLKAAMDALPAHLRSRLERETVDHTQGEKGLLRELADAKETIAELEAEIEELNDAKRPKPEDPKVIEDGFGGSWLKCDPIKDCKLQVVRPGKVQCLCDEKPESKPEPLIDPDCRAEKCGSCVGGPCEHHCHEEKIDGT